MVNIRICGYHGYKNHDFFFFIRVKTTFVREHGNSERILDALVVVKLFPTLKHVINLKTQKSFIGLWMSLSESDARNRVFIFFFFFFFLGSGFLMSFHRHSCPSIMIICIQPRAVVGADAGMVRHFFFFFLHWDGALSKLRTLRIGSGGTASRRVCYYRWFVQAHSPVCSTLWIAQKKFLSFLFDSGLWYYWWEFQLIHR